MTCVRMDRSTHHAAAQTAAAPVAPPKAEVLGVPLALTDYDGTLDWIDATVGQAVAATSASPPPTR